MAGEVPTASIKVFRWLGAKRGKGRLNSMDSKKLSHFKMITFVV